MFQKNRVEFEIISDQNLKLNKSFIYWYYKLSRKNKNHIGWVEYPILMNSLTTIVNWEIFMKVIVINCSNFKDKSENTKRKTEN